MISSVTSAFILVSTLLLFCGIKHKKLAASVRPRPHYLAAVTMTSWRSV